MFLVIRYDLEQVKVNVYDFEPLPTYNINRSWFTDDLIYGDSLHLLMHLQQYLMILSKHPGQASYSNQR